MAKKQPKAGTSTVKGRVKLPGSWTLLTRSAKTYRAHWRWFVGFGAICVLFAGIMDRGEGSGRLTLQTAWTIGYILPSAAWLAHRALSDDVPSKMHKIFYTGSQYSLQFFVTALVFILILSPLGGLLAIMGYLQTALVVAAVDANLIMFAVFAIVCIPFVLLMGRLILALNHVAVDGKKPTDAIALAWGSSRGVGSAIAGRLIVLMSMITLLLVLLLVPQAFFPWLAESALTEIIFWLAIYLGFVPLFYLVTEQIRGALR